MRYSPVKQSRGFTLVEVLVISPIIILFIGTFIALIVGLTGESLQLRTKNVAAYDAQAALDDIEDSVSQATGFLINTNGITYNPQGKNNSSTPFTHTATGESDTLIMRSAATTKSPFDPTRDIIYTGAGSSCNTKNAVYTFVTVFFVHEESGKKSLYKRTILPQLPACAEAWQRGSCHPSFKSVNPSICRAEDEKLLDDVSSIDVEYFENASSTQPLDEALAASATSVNVKINMSKLSAGTSITYDGSSRATSVNAQTSEGGEAPPTNPPITYTRDAATPYTTRFAWEPVGSATGGYNIRYRVGTSTWTGPVNVNQTQTTYDVPATGRKQNVDIEVSVVTGAGTYIYGTLDTSIPRWNTCNLTNGWANYGGYATAGFTRTISNFVGLKGLIRSGTVGYYSNNAYAVCTLPVGFRPAYRAIFNVASYDASKTNGRGWGRVDIDVDGTVSVVGGSNVWTSLDGIIFATGTAGNGWTNGILTNGWYFSNYGGEDYTNPAYVNDAYSRTWMRGLATYGTANTSIYTLPVGSRPAQSMHVPSQGGNLINISADGTTNGRAYAGGYRSMETVFYNSSFAGWKSFAFQNSWQNYGSGWSTGQCAMGADGITIMKGLINGGNINYPAVMTNIANTASGAGSCGVPNADGTFLLPAAAAGEVPASFDLGPDGNMVVTNASASWTSVDGIHFIAD